MSGFSLPKWHTGIADTFIDLLSGRITDNDIINGLGVVPGLQMAPSSAGSVPQGGVPSPDLNGSSSQNSANTQPSITPPPTSSNGTTYDDLNKADDGNTDYGLDDLRQVVDTLTSWMTGLFSSTGQIQQDNREYNAVQAQKQRDWLAYMSDTQYQRAVSDLRKAGLNPILALGGSFSGATVPSAAASGSNNSVSADTLGSLLALVAPFLEALLGYLPSSSGKSGIFVPSSTSGFNNNYGYR